MSKQQTSQINPLVYIVLGVLIFVTSLLVNANSETNFILFVFVGAGMALFGLIKLLIAFSRQAEGIETVNGQEQSAQSGASMQQSQHHVHVNRSQQMQHSQHQHIHTQHKTYAQRMQEQHYQTPNVPLRFCPHCGSRVGNANFCPICGTKLK